MTMQMSDDDIKRQVLKFINKACEDGIQATGEMIRKVLKGIGSDITLEDINSKDPERVNRILEEIERVHRIVKELKTEGLIDIYDYDVKKPYNFNFVQITEEGKKRLIKEI